MSKKEEGKKISVRLDAVTEKKLEEIMEARGLGQSEAIRQSIMGIPILHFGNVKQLGQEFCLIRTALENNAYDEKTEGKVDELCRFIRDVLREVED